MEQFVMFVLWAIFGVWMFGCIGKVGCIRCVLIRYTALIISLLLTSALL